MSRYRWWILSQCGSDGSYGRGSGNGGNKSTAPSTTTSSFVPATTTIITISGGEKLERDISVD